MESKELTAKEVLELIGKICEESDCDSCVLRLDGTCGYDNPSFGALNADEIIEACKQWKSEHAPIETEWAYICRIIEDKGNSKKCVYEEDVTVKGTNPFDSNQKTADDILKEYCKKHKGKFFAVVEHICRVKGDG